MLPDNGHVGVKLNLTGGLQAGKMPAMTNIAGPGGIVGVRVARQGRGRGNHEHGAQREQRSEIPGYRHGTTFRACFQYSRGIDRLTGVVAISGTMRPLSGLPGIPAKPNAESGMNPNGIPHGNYSSASRDYPERQSIR